MMILKPSIIIRNATADDAARACEIMRRSISELCNADHHGNSTILSAWLENKKPDIVRTWISRQDNSLLLAFLADEMVAVGSITDAGEIQLNYVSPDARFRGVSSAMLQALEQYAHIRGVSKIRLFSTETAHRFYQSRGYVDDAKPEGRFGTTSSYPMSKLLS